MTLEPLLEVLTLKALDRTGWVRHGIPKPESVAAHSWGVAWLALILLPAELDLQRALTYAVLHDLAEVRTGDITPHDGVSRDDKAAREESAMFELCRGLPRGAALLEAWRAYEAQADAESQFVRQLDRLDMALQAVRYTGPDRNTAPRVPRLRSERHPRPEPAHAAQCAAWENAAVIRAPPTVTRAPR